VESATLLSTLQAALGTQYTLERELGRGGMATVFLARDVRHRRAVAVKVLKPELSAVLGPERFLREIELTASLQHPHILPLFDSGAEGGLLYYVMPYVDGETLRERLTRERQLPVEDAVRLAREVASALSYAHGRGVIHRDVKPENVLLQGGHALVADFGIALAVQQAGGARMTQTGMSLGTPQYMPPEQATGEKGIDARADVYALGAVLYEMLAGEPPFTGLSAQAIVAKMLTEETTPLTLRRRSVPAHVDAAVRTALEKLPADRFESAAAFASALATPSLAEPAASRGNRTRTTRGAIAQARLSSPRTMTLLIGGTLIVGAALGWLGGWTRGRAAGALTQTASERGTARFLIEVDSGSLGPNGTALSPDGRTIIYAREGLDGTRLYARQLDELVARPLAGTENGQHPFFSPNGEWIAFYSNGAIRKLRLAAGGTPVLVTEVAGAVSLGGGYWTEDDAIVYATIPAGALYRVRANGGTPSRVAVTDTTRRVFFPQPLPGTRAILVTTRGDDYTSSRVGVLDLSTGELREFASGAGPRYAAGYVIYAGAAGGLFRQRFDLPHLAPSGIADEIANDLDVTSDEAAFAASRGGTLVYHSSRGGWALTLTDRIGRSLRVMPSLRPWSPRFDRDGRRVAYGAVAPGRQTSEVWITELTSGAPQRVTTDGNDSGDPQWSPDAKRIAYFTNAPGGKDLVVQALDSSVARVLTSRPGTQWTSDWIRDGSAVLFTDVTWDGEMAIWAQPMDSRTAQPSGLARRYIETPPRESGARASPNGLWVAYTSDETGRNEVYVQSYPSPGRKTLVSQGGGISPAWRGDGREIYYWQAGQLFAATVEPATPGEPLTVGTPRPLFRAPYVENVHANYDVSPDGSRFIIVTRDAKASRLVVALDLLGAARAPQSVAR
jgi:serine/threonine-protein kinase